MDFVNHWKKSAIFVDRSHKIANFVEHGQITNFVQWPQKNLEFCHFVERKKKIVNFINWPMETIDAKHANSRVASFVIWKNCEFYQSPKGKIMNFANHWRKKIKNFVNRALTNHEFRQSSAEKLWISLVCSEENPKFHQLLTKKNRKFCQLFKKKNREFCQWLGGEITNFINRALYNCEFRKLDAQRSRILLICYEKNPEFRQLLTEKNIAYFVNRSGLKFLTFRQLLMGKKCKFRPSTAVKKIMNFIGWTWQNL